jgi:hypothetical protein
MDSDVISYRHGERNTNFKEIDMNERHYISSGAQNKMYTLRVNYFEKVWMGNTFGSRMVQRDQYLKNLSIDKEKAVEKAQEYLPAGYKVEFDLFVIDRDGNRVPNACDLNPEILRFGKYFGKTVEEVKELDLPYLMWVNDNFVSEKNQPTIDQIAFVLKEELADRDSKYSKELADKATVDFERAKILSEIGNELVKLPWDFPQNIGKDMIGGSLPKGRGKHLVCDMMGKRLARRNSKVYKAEYARVEELVEIAEAI